jgi:hypothetical protein
MKREFSFYEFVGIMVPSITFLFFLNLIITKVYQITLVDFSKIGESIIFIVIAYGFGHLLQGLGNYFELFVWFIYGGMPTSWLTKKNRFGNYLFDKNKQEKLLNNVYAEYGKEDNKDYRRLIYTKLFAKKLTDRIDIFNGNYSLMRGLSVSFILLSFVCCYYFKWQIVILPAILSIIAVIRMFRFAKYYAKEVYRTYLVTKEL